MNTAAAVAISFYYCYQSPKLIVVLLNVGVLLGRTAAKLIWLSRRHAEILMSWQTLWCQIGHQIVAHFVVMAGYLVGQAEEKIKNNLHLGRSPTVVAMQGLEACKARGRRGGKLYITQRFVVWKVTLQRIAYYVISKIVVHQYICDLMVIGP